MLKVKPVLVTTPCYIKWRVFDSEMNEYEKMEDVPENVAQTQIHRAMFSSNYQPTNQVDYHLERCMRLLPHHNDCGGFFVALLKKTRFVSRMHGLAYFLSTYIVLHALVVVLINDCFYLDELSK